ncbi:kinesin-like protein NACK2 [Primulina eburnea]|uniref:kinesin-like protein NACK2 n=1 Tax=Primulina eburnea TaxID=1245227 RepID=UPI003C6BF400
MCLVIFSYLELRVILFILVVEKKQLVKHFHDEVARLEAEIQNPEPYNSPSLRSLLREKEMKIQQMEREIHELKRQRDCVQSQLELERSSHKEQKASEDHQPSRHVVKHLSYDENVSLSSKCDSKSQDKEERGKLQTSTGVLVNEIRNLETRRRQLGEEAIVH